MRRFARRLLETYLSADPRTLGLYRIVFGLVLLSDLWGRLCGVETWYTEAGLLPRSAIGYMQSPFLLAETRAQALFGMALCGLAFAALAVGFCTRAAQIASLVAVTSLNNRVGVLENGGDIVLNLLAVWTAFLPLGRRFSLDALRTGRRGDEPVVSLAVLAVLLQLAVIYLFNFLNKTGETWSEGSAVYYTLHQNRFATPLALWMRESLPYPVLRGLTWVTLALEAAALPLILSPFWTRWLRLIAIVALTALHLGFTSCLALGSFSWAMIAFLTLLLTREHWTSIERLLGGGPAGGRDARLHQPRPPAWLQRLLGVLREGLVLVLLAAAFGTLKQNPVWPRALTYEQPKLFRWLIRYPRLFQAWIMFSPDAPRSERILAVAARTRGGRSVDPYNEVASRAAGLARDPQAFTRRFFEQGLPRLGQRQLFAAYSERIAQPGWRVFHPALSDWILRYPERTGDPDDAIIAFEAYVLEEQTPPPGSTKGPRQRRLLGTFPEPGK